MVGSTATFTTELTETACAECGIVFAVPDAWDRTKRREGGSFFCPNGHKLTYGEGENAKLKRQLKAAESRRESLSTCLTAERDQHDATRRSLAARKGQITRMKNKLMGGTCTECELVFPNLGEHYAEQHPDFATRDA